MSINISGFTVVFKHPVSEEYMDKVEDALSIIEGVIQVERVVQDHDTYFGAIQENMRIKRCLFDLISSDFNKEK